MWLPTQLPSLARTWIAEALGMRTSNVRVIVPDVGGSFGSKWHLYPEDLAVAAMARATGKPVRWIEDRYEHFVSTVHAREQRTIISLDFDDQGCLRGIRSRAVADQGAYFHTAGPAPSANSVFLASGPYRVPVVDAAVAVSITNKTPYGAYRGFGQEAAIFALERGIDLLARDLGVDPVALRRRNLLRPDELPYKNSDSPGPGLGRLCTVFGRGSGTNRVRTHKTTTSLSGRGDCVLRREHGPGLIQAGCESRVDDADFRKSPALARARWRRRGRILPRRNGSRRRENPCPDRCSSTGRRPINDRRTAWRYEEWSVQRLRHSREPRRCQRWRSGRNSRRTAAGRGPSRRVDAP